MADIADHVADAPAASSTDAPNAHVAILTAYTIDYALGPVCAAVNRAYAARHGYAFLCREYPPWRNSDERHPTWNKVALLHEVLQSLLHPLDGATPLVPRQTTHLLWIDADAIVIRPERLFEELWTDVHVATGGNAATQSACLRHDMKPEPPVPNETIELIVGEDVTPACLINAGVLGVRVSEWSAALWTDVWGSASSRKFYLKNYHEQTSLLRQLERRGEGLDLFSHPFHSYRKGGPKRPKRFKHVAVLPRRMFNTNRCDVRATLPGTAVPVCGGPVRDEDACDFIFHAAGARSPRVSLRSHALSLTRHT